MRTRVEIEREAEVRARNSYYSLLELILEVLLDIRAEMPAYEPEP